MTNVPRNAFVLHSSVSTVCMWIIFTRSDLVGEGGGGMWAWKQESPHVPHRLTSIMSAFRRAPCLTGAPSAASISHKLCSSACGF